MKKVLFTLGIVLLLCVSCNPNKELEQSFLDYQMSETTGYIIEYKIEKIEILDTVTNKENVINQWNQMKNISSLLNDTSLNEMINQENTFKRKDNYYEFAKKHKGATRFVDEYLSTMDKALNIKKQGINNSSVSDKVEIIKWFVNRKNGYYGYTEKIILPISTDSMKVVEKIMNSEETPEYFRVRIIYTFINPIFNNTVKSNEVFHFDMQGKCFSSEGFNDQIN